MSSRGGILRQHGSARDSVFRPAKCFGAAIFALALLCGCAGGGRSVPAAPKSVSPDAAQRNRAIAAPRTAVASIAEVQSIGTANPTSATSVAATFATAPATGDLVLAGLSYYYNGGASPITMPAGWTKLSEAAHGNTGLGVYYRYAQANTLVGEDLRTFATVGDLPRPPGNRFKSRSRSPGSVQCSFRGARQLNCQRCHTDGPGCSWPFS